MTVSDLMEELSLLHPEAVVMIWDIEEDYWAPVSGLVHDSTQVKLYTDEP